MKISRWGGLLTAAFLSAAEPASARPPCNVMLDELTQSASEHHPPALKRIAPMLERFDAVFSADREVEAVMDDMLHSDFRQATFQIEAFMRLYEDDGGHRISRQRERVKALEDILGAWVDSVKMVDYARKIGAAPKAIAYLEGERDGIHNNFAHFLEKEGWVMAKDQAHTERESALSDLLNDLRKTEFKGEDQDRDYLLKEMHEHVKGVRDTEYDMNVLQTGIHEFRRQLRWIVLNAQTSRGLLLTDDGRKAAPIHGYDDLLKDPINESPFSRLEKSDIDANPCVVSRALYLGLVKAIFEFGEIKDAGEHEENLARAYRSAGLAKGEAEAREIGARMVAAQPGMTPYVPITKAAQRLYDEMHSKGLLKAFGQQIKDCY